MLTAQFISELNNLFADELSPKNTTKTEGRIRGWHCPIQSVQIGDFVIVPLTSTRKVKSEGYLMQNCVRDYIGRCRADIYQLFSIRNLQGDRIATLGAKKENDRWYFDDCLGKENSTVIESATEIYDDGNIVYEVEYTEIFSVAHEVVRLLNEHPADIHEV